MSRKIVHIFVPVFLILLLLSMAMPLVVAMWGGVPNEPAAESKPYVIATEPTNGLVYVPMDQRISITFSEQMNESSVKYTITPDMGLKASWMANSTILLLNRASLLSFFRPNTKYTINITEGRNLNGTAMDAYEFSFQTAPSPPSDDDDDGLASKIARAIWAGFKTMLVCAIYGPIVVSVGGIALMLLRPSDLFFSSNFLDLYWDIVLLVDFSLGIIFVIIGIMYMMSGFKPEQRARLKNIVPSMLIMLVLAHFSIYICQTALDLSNAVTLYILSGIDFKAFLSWTAFSNVWVVIIFGVVFLIVALIVLIMLAIRYIVIFFCTALMPLALVLYPIPQASWFSKNIFMMFTIMTFLNFFAAVLLRLGVAFMANVGWVGGFLLLGALLMIIALPSLLTKGVSAVTGVQTSLGSMALFPIAAGAAAAGAVAGGVKGFAAARAAGGGFMKAAGSGLKAGLNRFASGQAMMLNSGIKLPKVPNGGMTSTFRLPFQSRSSGGSTRSGASGGAAGPSTGEGRAQSPVAKLLKAHLSAQRGRQNSAETSMLRNRNIQAHIHERNNRVNAIRHSWHIQNDIERPNPRNSWPHATGGGA